MPAWLLYGGICCVGPQAADAEALACLTPYICNKFFMAIYDRILIVEGDFDLFNKLRIFLTSQGYRVEAAACGNDAIAKCGERLINLIILDTTLSDMDPIDVYRELRTTIRTSHIPVIFLGSKEKQEDFTPHLSGEADNYIAKPLDIENLKPMVLDGLNYLRTQAQVHPVTGLPTGSLIEAQLRNFKANDNRILLKVRIEGINTLIEKPGYQENEYNDVLIMTALGLNKAMSKFGSRDGFIGHQSDDSFVLITLTEGALDLLNYLHQLDDEIFTPIVSIDPPPSDGVSQIKMPLSLQIEINNSPNDIFQERNAR